MKRSLTAGLLAALLLIQPAAAAPAQTPFVAFHVPWDPQSTASLARHADQIDILAPLWITLRGPEAEVVFEPDPKGMALLATRKGSPAVYPVVSNAHDDVWDAASAQAAILDSSTRAKVLARLADLARTRRLSGFIFDFENLTPAAVAGFPTFLAAAKSALAPAGVEVWSTVSPGPDQPLQTLAAAGDAVVLMAYDACWATSTPGPIAGEDWLEATLARRLEGVDPRRVVIALGSYGYDWPEGGPASPIGSDAAIKLAGRFGSKVTRDPVSRNPNFSYTDAKGRRHVVWYVDAGAFALGRGAATAFHPRATALWRLGLEDPALWTTPLQTSSRRAAGGPLPHPCDPLPPR